MEREINRQLDNAKRYPAFGFVCYVYVFVFHLTYLRILLLSCSNLFVSALAYKNIFFLSLLLFVFALSLQEVISFSLSLSLPCLFLTIHACYTPTQACNPITEKQPNVSNNTHTGENKCSILGFWLSLLLLFL